jgi:invasion protein IalB
MKPWGPLALALAAAQPAAAQPAIDAPERTVAVFGDWSMRCEQRPEGRICEMAQTTQDQQRKPVAVVALGRATRDGPLRLVAQVPVNVQVAQAARLVLDAAGRQEAPLVLTFRNCVPAGCFAELELRDQAVLRRLRGRAADAAGRLEWRNAAGAEASIPVSFRGFAAAYDALAKQAD